MDLSPSHSRAGKWLRRYRRRVLTAVILGILAGGAAILPAVRDFDRRGIDYLLILRHWAYGPLFPPSQSDVVVVAIDEQTYHSDPFVNTPIVAWTPYLGFIIEAIDKAEPKAIGLDKVLPTTLDRPELLRGYDRPFLQALRKAADNNRIVLGQFRISAGEGQSPYAGQILAARGQNNVRLVNVNMDGDEVVRTYVHAYANQEGGETPSFGVELAQRAGAPMPAEDFIINFNTGLGDIPIYSMADIYACAQDGKDDYFHQAFAGKIVLFGETLDVEDRRLSAKRLVWDEAANAKAAPTRCKLAPDFRFSPSMNRESMPGVLIHAAAINTLTKNIALRPVSGRAAFAMVAGATIVLALVFFFLEPIAGATLGVGALALEFAASTAALQAHYVAPTPSLLLSGVLTFTLAYAYRFVIEDRDKRRVQHAFRHYLAPALVEQLSENPDALKLGGERRQMTVMFTDIAGFTTISEGLKETPEKLVDLMNRYLTVMSGVVSRHEGYVDKFIGDAVMAVWGAPLRVEDAERKAVETALGCHEELKAFNRDVVGDFLPNGKLGTRIGIATGFAIAGNMGSSQRLNYTVTGDMVNLAARLEGANKEYGTSIMISDQTAKALGDGYVLRRLDRLIVKGKTEPITVYEVVGRRGEVGEDVLARLAEFERALALHDSRDFVGAGDIFQTLAPDDPPSELYAERCATYMVIPPPPEWQGEFALKTK